MDEERSRNKPTRLSFICLFLVSMLRKSGIMINLKKIPAAVYEDNIFQLFLIYGGAWNGWISTIRSYGEWSCLPVSENYSPELQEDINLILYYSLLPNQLHEINPLCF